MEPQDKKRLRLKQTLTGTGLILFILLLLCVATLFGQSASIEEKYAQDFRRVMRMVKQRYVDEVDEQKLFDGAIKGLFESLEDPYSAYLSQADMQMLNDTISGEFGGLGIYIDKKNFDKPDAKNAPKDKYIKVVAPIEDTPAFRAGIHAGDYITAIDDKPVDDLNIDQVLSVLRGRPGTKVALTILRGESTLIPFVLERAVIQVPVIKSVWLEPDIAYMRITQFTPQTPVKFYDIIQDFKKKEHFTKLIVDLRGDPGGLLEAAVKIANGFLKEGVIVSTRSKISEENHIYEANSDTIVPEDVQVVMLINKGSASASEIVAAALKQNKRAFLLGETTFGKGSVQKIEPIGDAAFKLTIARFYDPLGNQIDKIGVTPHETIKEKELTEEEIQQFKKLYEGRQIEELAQTHPSQDQIEDFLKKLHKEGITLEDRYLRKLVKEAINNTNNATPLVVDRDFDIVLQKAIQLLQKGTLVLP